jgi:hypothetical protein
MPTQGARTAMLMGGAMLATLSGGSLAGMAASAQEIAPPVGASLQSGAAGDVIFADQGIQLSQTNKSAIDLTVHEDRSARFAILQPFSQQQDAPSPRAVELELSANGDVTGMPLDFSIAQRASFGSDSHGDINRHSRGAEVRVGRALGEPRGELSSASQSRIYVFAASDDEALTWQPGAESQRFGYQQDRVEIGDMQAGVTYERGTMQASIAYVEREISATVGQTSMSNEENFAGVTLTMRR